MQLKSCARTPPGAPGYGWIRFASMRCLVRLQWTKLITTGRKKGQVSWLENHRRVASYLTSRMA